MLPYVCFFRPDIFHVIANTLNVISAILCDRLAEPTNECATLSYAYVGRFLDELLAGTFDRRKLVGHLSETLLLVFDGGVGHLRRVQLLDLQVLLEHVHLDCKLHARTHPPSHKRTHAHFCRFHSIPGNHE